MTADDEQPDERGEDAPAEGAEQPAAEVPAEQPAPDAEADQPDAEADQPDAEADQPDAEADQPDAEADQADAGEQAADGEEPAAEQVPRKRGVRRPRRKQAGAEDSEEQPAAKKPRGKAAAEKAPAEKAAKEKAAKEKAPAPAPRRKPGTGPRRRVVRARARYVRTSARKARMVCGHLRGKTVEEARAILAFTPREAARDWSKLLESAVANAESNHELLEEDLIVREAYADEGPTIKRFRPRAMGRATPIAKRTSHLTIALAIRAEPVAANTRKRKKD